MSDPSANINYFVRGGWKSRDTAGTRARSENEGLDALGCAVSEVDAGDIRDGTESNQYLQFWS